MSPAATHRARIAFEPLMRIFAVVHDHLVHDQPSIAWRNSGSPWCSLSRNRMERRSIFSGVICGLPDDMRRWRSAASFARSSRCTFRLIKRSRRTRVLGFHDALLDKPEKTGDAGLRVLLSVAQSLGARGSGPRAPTRPERRRAASRRAAGALGRAWRPRRRRSRRGSPWNAQAPAGGDPFLSLREQQ